MTKKISRVVSVLSLIAIFLGAGAFGASANSGIDATSAFSTVDVLRGEISCGSASLAVSQKGRAGTQSSDCYRDIKLYVGGMPFGVKFITAGVIVAGFNNAIASGGVKNPSRAAGIECNDLIISVDGREITSAVELNTIVEGSGGRLLTVKYSRDGKEYTTKIKPIYSQAEGRYTTGIYVRDSGAGIGTVTYIVPQSLAFGGLGHGICDGETGRLIPMQRGAVVNVKINGIVTAHVTPTTNFVI